jgi:hypothetical protein
VPKKAQEYKPFPAIACQRIRNLMAAKAKTDADRKSMFDARDHAKEELGKLDDGGGSAKRKSLEADYGKACLEIDRLASTAKWLNSELRTTVEKADEPGLFDTAEISVPDFTEQRDEDEGQDGEAAASRSAAPIGKQPSGPRAPKAIEPPEGTDQHLTASVNELDLPEQLKGKLVAAGYVEVRHIEPILRDGLDPEALMQAMGIGQEKLAQIKRAVKAFVTSHRRADREVSAEPFKLKRA